MTEPRILHVSSARTWRGGEQQIKYLLDWQGENNVKSFLLCPEKSALSSASFHENVSLYSLPRRSSVDFSFAKKIAEIVRKENLNIVHLHDSHSHTAGILAHLFFGLKVPLILHRRVAVKGGKGLLSKFKYRHRSIKKIICVSNKVKEILLPVLKEPDRATVIYDGIDPGRWKNLTSAGKQLTDKYNIPEDAFIIAHIGALEAEKGFFTFLDTAVKINKKKENCFFLIVGDGSLMDALKKYAAAHNINNLIFTGFVKDLREILPHIDVLLFTPVTEGLGSTILDAMSCGIPVVSTLTGGIPELIQHGKNGLLAAPDDSEALSLHTIRVMEDKPLAQKIVNAASERVRAFSKDRIAQETHAIYLEILNLAKAT